MLATNTVHLWRKRPLEFLCFADGFFILAGSFKVSYS